MWERSLHLRLCKNKQANSTGIKHVPDWDTFQIRNVFKHTDSLTSITSLRDVVGTLTMFILEKGGCGNMRCCPCRVGLNSTSESLLLPI